MIPAKYSLKNITDADNIIYIAPLLVISSFFYIFENGNNAHEFGQLEILGAIIICCYYLWDKIAVVYPPAMVGKRRIEEIVCIVIGLFSALIFLPPLMTWEFINLYRASDRFSFNKGIIISILTLWIGCGTLYYSSYKLAIERYHAANFSQSSFRSSDTPTGEISK